MEAAINPLEVDIAVNNEASWRVGTTEYSIEGWRRSSINPTAYLLHRYEIPACWRAVAAPVNMAHHGHGGISRSPAYVAAKQGRGGDKSAARIAKQGVA